MSEIEPIPQATDGRSVIHIGVHKTASTTLQHSLYALRHEIAKQGFYYPVNILPLPAQHSNIATFLRFGKPEQYRDAMSAVLRGFRKKARRNLILSGEEFSLLGPRQIKMLYGDLTQTGQQFHVVLYIRNLYRIAISTIAELSKNGRFIAYPDRVMERIEPRKARLSTIISDWERVFGKDKVIVACLEALPPESSILSHFADVAGITIPRDFRIVTKNQSPDPIASAMLTHLAYEYGISSRAFFESYFSTLPDRLAFPKIEDELLETTEQWVSSIDLSHPKLADFYDFLTRRPPTGEGVKLSSAEYLRLLATVLLRTAETIAPQALGECVNGE